MAKPILYNLLPFDKSEEATLKFLWNGNQAFGNICTISDKYEKVIYEESQTTMQLKHTIDANTLQNGNQYIARIRVLDADNNVSEISDPMLFYCFTPPTFEFINIEEGQIIKNASYEVEMKYSQIENEPLQSWEISVYDTSRSLIHTSGICYTEEIKYTITNLEDKQDYFIKATCMTLNGMEISTEYIPFQARYKYPEIYSLLTLENVANNGYIKLRSNIRAVEAHSLKDVEYIDGEYANLKDNTIYINDDFSLDDDFAINLLGYNLTPNSLIMELSDGVNMINLYLRKGKYDTNDNIEKTYVELNSPISSTFYICYSNYIPNPSSSDIIDIWIKKKNGLYSLYITNKGGT